MMNTFNKDKKDSKISKNPIGIIEADLQIGSMNRGFHSSSISFLDPC